MNFFVMSKAKAIDILNRENLPEHTIVISISDTNSIVTLPQNKNVDDILSLHFDDVERGEPNCIKMQDACAAINFIANHPLAENVIVHCGGGISRSAGMAAALMLIFNGTDFPIFNNGIYCPNMTVYRTVLNCHFGNLNEEAITKKEELNLKAWKVKHSWYCNGPENRS